MCPNSCHQAFVSGGLLPAAMRGTNISAPIHICDWYSTFSKMAGVDPADDHAGVPSIDSIDQTSVIFGQATTPARDELFPASGILISGQWKLSTTGMGADKWSGQMYPSVPAESPTTPFKGCSTKSPCLWDIVSDPEERDECSSDNTALVTKLAAVRDSSTNISADPLSPSPPPALLLPDCPAPPPFQVVLRSHSHCPTHSDLVDRAAAQYTHAGRVQQPSGQRHEGGHLRHDRQKRQLPDPLGLDPTFCLMSLPFAGCGCDLGQTAGLMQRSLSMSDIEDGLATFARSPEPHDAKTIKETKARGPEACSRVHVLTVLHRPTIIGLPRSGVGFHRDLGFIRSPPPPPPEVLRGTAPDFWFPDCRAAVEPSDLKLTRSVIDVTKFVDRSMSPAEAN